MRNGAKANARIVTLGEALVDMMAAPANAAFHPAAGGAPANVAVGAARLGAPAGFIGKVGADMFGDFLTNELQRAGVDVTQVSRAPSARTSLAFVTNSEDGEREFLFYREKPADLQLSADDYDSEYVKGAAVLHVGSLSLASEPARAATLRALKLATDNGVPRSVDPNLRLDQWPNASTARTEILNLAKRAVVLKLSADELEFLAGGAGEKAARTLMLEGTALVCVTKGRGGVDYYTHAAYGSVPALNVKAVDTTGAGDAFTAAVLVGLSRFESFEGAVADVEALEALLARANAFAGLSVTRRGAAGAYPTEAELDRFMRGAKA